MHIYLVIRREFLQNRIREKSKSFEFPTECKNFEHYDNKAPHYRDVSDFNFKTAKRSLQTLDKYFQNRHRHRHLIHSNATLASKEVNEIEACIENHFADKGNKVKYTLILLTFLKLTIIF